jgi:predicted RNA-binding protein Jag
MKQNKSSSAQTINVQAKTLEQALIKACGTLGVSQEGLGYKILKEDTSKGFMSFFKASSVEIEAWTTSGNQSRSNQTRDRDNSNRDKNQRDNNHRDSSQQNNRRSEPRAPRKEHTPAPRNNYNDDSGEQINVEPLSAEKTTELVEELRQFCAGICERIAGEPVTVSATNSDGRLVLNVENEYISSQINKNSKLAEAMEHILRKKPRHLRQELPFRIFVDVSGSRRQREEDLIQMAQDLSSKVHENKRPIVLNYKSSYDRKIIHMALDKDDRVYTKSIGSGPNRKLMILPVKDALSGAIEVDA